MHLQLNCVFKQYFRDHGILNLRSKLTLLAALCGLLHNNHCNLCLFAASANEPTETTKDTCQQILDQTWAENVQTLLEGSSAPAYRYSLIDPAERISVSGNLTDSRDFLLAAWLAGGNKREDWPRFAVAYQRWLAQCQAFLGNKESAGSAVPQSAVTSRPALRLLIYLRQHVLKSYDPQASDLQTVFLTGKFNCLSGTILYLALANDMHISAVGISREGHCSVAIPRELPPSDKPSITPDNLNTAWLPLEPTAPVELMKQSERVLFGNKLTPTSRTAITPANLKYETVSTTANTLFSPTDTVTTPAKSVEKVFVSPRDANWPFAWHPAERHLTRRAILGLLWYNRGVDAYQQQYYVQAAKFLLGACQADPGHLAARANLWAALNASAIQLANAGATERARSILNQILAIEPDQAETGHNLLYLEQF